MCSACFVRLPASWKARLGRRVSDCVVACKVWGWVGECGFLFVAGASCGCLRRERLVSGVASRTGSLLLRFGGVWVDVNLCFVFRVRRVVAYIAGGSSRASRLGLGRCF